MSTGGVPGRGLTLEQARELGVDRGHSRVRRLYLDACPVGEALRAWEHTGDTPAVAAVAGWLEQPAGSRAPCLVLRGGVGTGKTYAACFAVRRWCEATGGIYSAAPIVSWLRPRELVTAVLHAYREHTRPICEYVVLDDLGIERDPSDVSEALCELFDAGGRSLLITTNLTRDQMRDRYDPRLIDRLNHHARAFDLKGSTKRKTVGEF